MRGRRPPVRNRVRVSAMYRGDISVLRFRPDKARVCQVGLPRNRGGGGPDGATRRAARVRRPRPASREPDARLRAAQAAQHRSRRLPGAVLRLALPGAARAARPAAGSPRSRGRPAGSGSRRARIVYELTADGKEHFQELVDQAGPTPGTTTTSTCASPSSPAPRHEVRLRILEGRRSRLEERLANVREASARNRERLDAYTVGAPAARRGAGRARGPLARRADRRRARQPSTRPQASTYHSTTPPHEHPNIQENPWDQSRRHRRRRQLRQLAGAGRRVLQGR